MSSRSAVEVSSGRRRAIKAGHSRVRSANAESGWTELEEEEEEEL